MKYYKAEEIADILDFDRETILRKLRGGEIPGIKIGNQWRVSNHDLNLYLEGSLTPMVKNDEKNKGEEATDNTLSDTLINLLKESLNDINPKEATKFKISLNERFRNKGMDPIKWRR